MKADITKAVKAVSTGAVKADSTESVKADSADARIESAVSQLTDMGDVRDRIKVPGS